MTISRLIPVVAGVAGIAAFTPPAALADAAEAKSTAATHAGLAANQDAIGGVRTHLHHTLNCLVGPEGEGFDDSVGNPCAQAGYAIPETADAEMKEMLTELAEKVRMAIAGEELMAAKDAATEIQETLAE
jgi:hypothetical protein